MPLPLIPIAIIGVSALIGGKKGYDAISDSSKADEINQDAKFIIENAKSNVENAQDICSTSLQNLGSRKIFLLENSIDSFIKSYQKIKNINKKDSQGLDELSKFSMDEKSFDELKDYSILASGLLKSVGAGGVAGALTAFGAYNATMALATTAGGTAISTLSGVAATNATLAWLGGGALGAGGLGMAGGTMILGGMVAAPALAVMGFVLSAKAEKKLEDARSNLAQAKQAREELKNVEILALAIARRAEMFYRLLVKNEAIFAPLVSEMDTLLSKKDYDFSLLNEDEQKMVAKTVTSAKTLKTILDTPILDKDGNPTKEAEELINSNLLTM